MYAIYLSGLARASTIHRPETTGGAMAAARFVERLNEQIAQELTVSQQYIANAVHFDGK
jgi:hypothetical protein